MDAKNTHRDPYPDDARYLSWERRAEFDQRFVVAPAKNARLFETCFCGKTVLSYGITCPRQCSRPSKVTI